MSDGHSDRAAGNSVPSSSRDQVLAGLERVAATSGRMIVAVSGGPDSTALLVRIERAAPQETTPTSPPSMQTTNYAGEESDGENERFGARLC